MTPTQQVPCLDIGGSSLTATLVVSSLFLVPGLGLLLLVITGIRNAWDLVLWTAQQQHKE